MNDIRKTRKYRNRKKWVTAATATLAVSASMSLMNMNAKEASADEHLPNSTTSNVVLNDKKQTLNLTDSKNKNNINFADEKKVVEQDQSKDEQDVSNNDKEWPNGWVSVHRYSEPTGENKKGNYTGMQVIDQPDSQFNNPNNHTTLGIGKKGNQVYSGIWPGTNKSKVTGDVVTIKTPSGYEYDPTFEKEADPSRYREAGMSNGTNGQLNMDTAKNSQAYHYYYKRNNSKSYDLKSDTAHAYQTVINWFDYDYGYYLGSTRMNDYSMGLGGRKFASDSNTKGSDRNNTDYLVKAPIGYKFTINKNEDGSLTFKAPNEFSIDDPNKDSDHPYLDVNPNYVKPDGTKLDPLHEGVFHANEWAHMGYFDASQPDYNGENIHILRAYVEYEGKKANDKMPSEDSLPSQKAQSIIIRDNHIKFEIPKSENPNYREVVFRIEDWGHNKILGYVTRSVDITEPQNISVDFSVDDNGNKILSDGYYFVQGQEPKPEYVVDENFDDKNTSKSILTAVIPIAVTNVPHTNAGTGIGYWSDWKPVTKVTLVTTIKENNVIFVDDDNNGKKVDSITISGKSGEKKTLTLAVPTHYQLAKGQSLPTSYTFKASDNQPIEIHLVHVKQDVSSTDKGASKTVTRTITVTKPNGSKYNLAVQKATLTRTATKDEVTGTVSYGNKWNPDKDSWKAVTIPNNITGYTPSQSEVQAVEVTGKTSDQTIYVTYSANAQSNTVEFLDDDKNGSMVGSPITISGKSGEKKTLTLAVPTHYQLAKGQSLPTSYTFKASDNQPIEIHLVHVKQDVSSTDKGASKTVTRTITVTKPDGSQYNLAVQKATLTRTATEDEVTGTVSYGDWNAGNFAKVTIPKIDGYTPLVNGAKNATDKLGSMKVTANTPNQTINITYVSNKSDVVKYNPEARKDYQVAAGTKINKGSNAINMITNMKDLPQNTTAVWDQVPDTSNSSYTDKKPSAGTLTVTYPDKTSVEVPVVITVLPSVRPVQPVQPSEPIDIVPTEPEENKPATPTTPANTVSTNNTSTINETVSNKHLVLTHNAFLYTRKGLIIRHKGKTIVWKRGRHITKYGKIVLIKGKKFYNVKRNAYVKVSNTLVYRKRIFKLTHNAFVYNAKGHAIRAKKHGLRLALRKKNTHVKAWNNGISVMIKGKAYYQIGKNAFIKVGNTIPRKASAYTER